MCRSLSLLSIRLLDIIFSFSFVDDNTDDEFVDKIFEVEFEILCLRFDSTIVGVEHFDSFIDVVVVVDRI
ncbi:hypothetical protein DERP_006122 [Dermatophagoides pteronyssinus]|uniref:Uncharacterized protein n=1 Tax=Dermatophagoides pteronyssinus TaxID=6956 RepID=A0ABQ8JSC4_DERPT|nr:hypothetical protein DERP_006122 [Dermatophagoides pteronyssinus]